ncbi:hypothetical protein B0T25DRAFT_534879 [Lasiosphaeria hispida]|uniref:Secreted protein n=1 Tax=Lasiosphaeria hispida TaxID=260671 RepID=A0AAJ0HRJ6_9PEZI|nr:hypothetical protein B0T25DRAFT_534879 [Lasiosphaeria hispida]
MFCISHLVSRVLCCCCCCCYCCPSTKGCGCHLRANSGRSAQKPEENIGEAQSTSVPSGKVRPANQRPNAIVCRPTLGCAWI